MAIDIESYQWMILGAWFISLALPKPKKYFRLFLLGCLVCELVLADVASRWLGTNYPVINVYAVLCTCYYFYYFYTEVRPAKWKQWALLLFLGFLTYALLNYIMIEGVFRLNNLSYVAGMGVVMIPLVAYFVQMATSDYQNTFLQEGFWLGTAIVLFYSSSFPFLRYVDQILLQGKHFYKPLYDLLIIGNHFLALGYLMVVLCPFLNRHLISRNSSDASSSLPSSSR